MRTRFFLLLVGLAAPMGLPAALAAGCGSSIKSTPPGSTGGAGGAGGQGGGFPITVGTGGEEAGADALPDYTDPGCPDGGPKMTMFTCDAYHQGNGDCPPGQGCYIFVTYPTDPCSGEVYGTECAPAGPGMQGDPCNGAGDCGAGFTCVVTGSGDQCVALCNLDGQDTCTDGDVCEPIDVQGFGGCL
jgi:hypothetical protein